MRKPVLILLLLLCASLPALAYDAQVCGLVQVFFSPHGGCTEAVVHELDQAKNSALVQAYSFTSKPLLDALVRAQGRGVHVRVISDRTNETSGGSVTHDLQAAGIDVGYDEVHRIAHNKVMILDGETVLTGSFNWTRAAEDTNAENLLVVKSPDLARVYTARWEELRAICVDR
jgi:phosphatidylserine/phosphatidylglycerophosphate/cardiolipin synthase-like enzyme